MHRFKAFFVATSIIMLLAAFICDISLAAEVTKVHRHKGHIYIDEGKDAGYTMGAEVCFYSFSGEEITCGRVRQTSDSHAMVKVNNRIAKKIKKGMEARLQTTKPGE